MCKKTAWETCVEFHGHECMGLAIGYKQAILALQALDVTKAVDEELLVVVENDACGVDAIQVLTGCTLGKGNFIYKDAGKQAMTLANRKTGKAVRVLKKQASLPDDDKFQETRKRIMNGTADEKEKAEWGNIQKERIMRYLSLPGEQSFFISEAAMPQIEEARIFNTIVCAKCGEPFAEVKAHVADGQIICSDCSQGYTRGW